MRLLLGLAMLIAAVPASAQESGLPLWLVGKWCPSTTAPRSAEFPALDVDYVGPGPHCMTWIASADGTLSGSKSRGYFGRNDSYDFMTISVSGQRLRYLHASAFDAISPVRPVARLREVSRAPFAVAFQRRARGEMYRVAYRREGDRLFETIISRAGEAPYEIGYWLRPAPPAQGDLPEWMVGTWCRSADRRPEPIRELRWFKAVTARARNGAARASPGRSSATACFRGGASSA